MGAISRLRSIFGLSPAASTRPKAALHEGASSGRRLSMWSPTSQDINAIHAGSGGELTRRSRQQGRENPYGISAKASFAAHLIGTGITPSSKIKSLSKRQALNDLWDEWVEEADADGAQDFYGLQATIANELFVAGECFVRIRRRRTADNMSVPIQLQLLAAEHLDRSYTTIMSNGRRVVNGIEMDRLGRRRAYHMWRQHPGSQMKDDQQRIAVPADQILHIFLPQEPGQLRGMPIMAGGLVRMYNLDLYDDAELERKKVAALVSAWVTRSDESQAPLPGMDAAEDASGATDGTSDGVMDYQWSPGGVHVLPPGEEFNIADPADVGGSYEAFQYRQLLAIASSLGIPYAQMTGDVEKANYSNTRAAMLEQRRRVTQMQRLYIIPQLCKPVWRIWTEAAVLSGALRGNLNEMQRKVKWIPPRWDWVDPLKDWKAEEIAVNNGFKTRSAVIEGQGESAEETDERFADDKEREERLGLSFGDKAASEPQEIEDDQQDDDQQDDEDLPQRGSRPNRERQRA